MKFKQYLLNEKLLNNGHERLERIAKLIKKDCKPYLNDVIRIYKNYFFYSGRNDSRDFLKKDVRQDRVPRDTPPEIHEFLDEWFKRKFGVRARSQSVFCSFYESDADGYGNIYYVFPVGEYKAISNKDINDLSDSIVNNVINSTESVLRIDGKVHISKFNKVWSMLSNKQKEEIFKKIEKFLNASNYENKAFSKTEQMIICKRVYLVNKDWVDKSVTRTFEFEEMLLNII